MLDANGTNRRTGQMGTYRPQGVDAMLSIGRLWRSFGLRVFPLESEVVAWRGRDAEPAHAVMCDP